jgi:hypothetical protein
VPGDIDVLQRNSVLRGVRDGEVTQRLLDRIGDDTGIIGVTDDRCLSGILPWGF